MSDGNWIGQDGKWRTRHNGRVLVWENSLGWVDDPEATVDEPKEEYGPVCQRCGELQPYAVKTEGFKCWACRQPH